MEKTAGFTASQIESVRNRSVLSDDGSFEKCAQASTALLSALAGAGVGAGAGLTADLIRPVDEDEDVRRRRLAAILSGAVLGGVAGVGYDQFKKNAPAFFPQKRSVGGRIFDALDPAPSTAIAAGGLGYWLKPHLSNGGRIREWIDPERTKFFKHPLPIGAKDLTDKKNLELASALAEYENTVSSGKIRSGINRLAKLISGGRLKPFQEVAVKRNKGIKETAINLTRALAKNEAGGDILKKMMDSPNGQAFLKVGPDKSIRNFKGVAKALSHSRAKLMRAGSPAGRAGRAAALAAGLLALGYRLTK